MFPIVIVGSQGIYPRYTGIAVWPDACRFIAFYQGNRIADCPTPAAAMHRLAQMGARTADAWHLVNYTEQVIAVLQRGTRDPFQVLAAAGEELRRDGWKQIEVSLLCEQLAAAAHSYDRMMEVTR